MMYSYAIVGALLCVLLKECGATYFKSSLSGHLREEPGDLATFQQRDVPLLVMMGTLSCLDLHCGAFSDYRG